jgi:hypothetical protein
LRIESISSAISESKLGAYGVGTLRDSSVCPTPTGKPVADAMKLDFPAPVIPIRSIAGFEGLPTL